ncbi:MAG: class 1 fructose-bisphosphatase [Gemmobacter sp.]
MAEQRDLTDHLATAAEAGVAVVVEAIATVAGTLSRRIARGPLDGALGDAVGANPDGDMQKALDVIADAAFAAALRDTPVRWLASEETDAAQELDPAAPLAVAIDPLDGSSNIEVNVSIGTIFSIRPARESAEATFLRPGSEQIAAGYVIYGPQTILVLTLGAGVAAFLHDPVSGRWPSIAQTLRIAPAATEFAINASNYRVWSRPIRAYVDDLVAGEDGPRGRNFNMRWVASLVAETHRILMRGGIFLYPADSRRGYEHGRLRMVYECAPIAMIVEQAGGSATDGRTRILGQVPEGLHARTPFVFGSAEKVARVAAYHDLPDTEVSPLFGKRGLFSVEGAR